MLKIPLVKPEVFFNVNIYEYYSNFKFIYYYLLLCFFNLIDIIAKTIAVPAITINAIKLLFPV